MNSGFKNGRKLLRFTKLARTATHSLVILRHGKVDAWTSHPSPATHHLQQQQHVLACTHAAKYQRQPNQPLLSACSGMAMSEEDPATLAAEP